MDKRTCSVEGCSKSAEKRGWCGMHYRRWQRTGSTGDAEPKRHEPGSIPCKIDGCESAAKSLGLCNKHYLRHWQTGSTADPVRAEYPEICIIDGCDGAVMARGWCRKHYLRWYRLGDTGTPPRFTVKFCSVEGCGIEVVKWGLCGKHHARMKKRGTTDDPPPKPAECAVDGCDREPRSRGWCKRHYKVLTGQGSAHEMKRYAQKLGSQVEPVSYERLIEMYGMVCHLCGGEIASRRDLNMDHVIPLARRGPHTYANIRPAHGLCNRRKSDKLMSEIAAIG